MKLRSLILLAALTYTLVIGGGMLFYRLVIVYPELENITLNSHKDDFKIIQRAYLAKLEAMDYLNLDWSKWDDLLHYSKLQNEDFIENNILVDSFQKSMVDVVSIYDENKQHLFTAKKTESGFVEQPNLDSVTPRYRSRNHLQTKDSQWHYQNGWEIGILYHS